MYEELSYLLILKARLESEIDECNSTQQYKRAELLEAKINKIDDSIDRINMQIIKDL